jgi:hypothetical protein
MAKVFNCWSKVAEENYTVLSALDLEETSNIIRTDIAFTNFLNKMKSY